MQTPYMFNKPIDMLLQKGVTALGWVNKSNFTCKAPMTVLTVAPSRYGCSSVYSLHKHTIYLAALWFSNSEHSFTIPAYHGSVSGTRFSSSSFCMELDKGINVVPLKKQGIT